MDKDQKLSCLYNAVISENGGFIREYLIERMIAFSSSPACAEQIKGMGMLINELDDVKDQFHKQQQERNKR